MMQKFDYVPIIVQFIHICISITSLGKTKNIILFIITIFSITNLNLDTNQ